MNLRAAKGREGELSKTNSLRKYIQKWRIKRKIAKSSEYSCFPLSPAKCTFCYAFIKLYTNFQNQRLSFGGVEGGPLFRRKDRCCKSIYQMPIHVRMYSSIPEYRIWRIAQCNTVNAFRPAPQVSFCSPQSKEFFGLSQSLVLPVRRVPEKCFFFFFSNLKYANRRRQYGSILDVFTENGLLFIQQENHLFF